MRFEMIFLTAILGIAGIHLLSNLINFLVKSSPARERINHKEKASDDWYAFFKKSDFYGDGATTLALVRYATYWLCDSRYSCRTSRAFKRK